MSTLNVNRIVDASGGVFAPVSSVFKNRIINGAMVIDQRNAGASVTPSSSTYLLDRWQCVATNQSRFSYQQSTTAPVGFQNSLLATVVSAYSVTAGDFIVLQQQIEGFNIADLNWGTVNAKTVTLSFWVRSSLTGTFGGYLTNGNNTRSYPFTYTISAANTWEQKSLTIAGDTTGTWNVNNTTGIQVGFSLGVGSTFNGTAGAWAGSTFLGATGATSIVGTSGATWQITGVQLEVGTQATSFEYRQYGTELSLCERYYWRSTVGTYNAVGSGSVTGSTQVSIYIKYPTTMRAAPTVSYVGTIYTYAASNQTVTAIASSYAGNSSGRFDFTPNASMTVGQGAILFTEQTGTNYVQATAEL